MVNSIADKHVCLLKNQGRSGKKRPPHGGSEAWAEGDTVATGTLTAWQEWTFPVTPCWLLGLDTTIWIILILASLRVVMRCGAKGFLSSPVYIKHVASEIQCYAAFMLRCFHITTTRSQIQLCSPGFACALPPQANKKTQQPVDPWISMRFLRNSRLWLEVITWVQKKRKEAHMRSGLKATGHSRTT